MKTLEKLHIINYCRQQIKVSPDVADEKDRLQKNTLPSIAEPKVRNIDHDKFVTIVHLNVRNVMAKKEDLKCDCNIQKAGVVCFTESHLGKNDKITPNKIGLRDNMEIFHCDQDNNGGGVIICVHSWYNPKVLQADQCGLELVGVEIHVPDPVFIFCLYRPPTYSCADIYAQSR